MKIDCVVAARAWRAVATCTLLVLPAVVTAQDTPPVIRSIRIRTQNIFDSTQARSSFLYRAANAIHGTTRPSVVRSELLFREGDRLDPARIAETIRNLRARNLFRDVVINTVRDGDSVDIEVTTFDGWTTELVINARVTDGQFTWALGGQERNFLGTGARVGLVYRKEPDRSAWTVRAGHDRIAASRFGVEGLYDNLSDGVVGRWRVGAPFRALSDRTGINLLGEVADQRVLQFVNGEIAETYNRRAFIQRVNAGYAPTAGPEGYVRVGFLGQIRREEFVLAADTGMFVPDSVTGTFGGFAQMMLAQFKVVTHFNTLKINAAMLILKGLLNDNDFTLKTMREAKEFENVLNVLFYRLHAGKNVKEIRQEGRKWIFIESTFYGRISGIIVTTDDKGVVTAVEYSSEIKATAKPK